jgi:hypothetical protein
VAFLGAGLALTVFFFGALVLLGTLKLGHLRNGSDRWRSWARAWP